MNSKYDHRQAESRWYDEWERAGGFTPPQTPRGKPFVMVIPPPNVTGSLHMGHALEHAQHDVLARWRRMKGDDVLWLPGTDHAGIATQVIVERELKKEGKTRHDLGREAFIERVWQWKKQSGDTIVHQMRRMGNSCDWSRLRFTMDPMLSKAVQKVFIDLYREGLIYRGTYLVNWCPRCRTAISDLEVVHQQVKGKLYHLRYPAADGKGHLIVATTRPETMLGDTAVAVHPEDSRYQSWIGREIKLPVTGRLIKVIADAMVAQDFGTGAVKVTPAHDPNDYELGKRHQLEQVTILTLEGKIIEGIPKYAGLDRFKAREQMVLDFEQEGVLEKTEDHLHAVGHCQRCQTIVEPMLSMQWFVKTAPLAKPAREAVADGRTRFVPNSWKATYFEWMDNIRDWCISRQLWWGHRIPAYHCQKCQEVHVAEEKPSKCQKCGHQTLEQDPDVLDTWFSSALWPFSTMGWPDQTEDFKRFYPTTTLITGFDIIFFWVARMMMMGIKFTGQVPFKTVHIHALVRDAEGQKMSKTKGNVMDPLTLVDQYGADAVRFTLMAMSVLGRDIRLSEQRIQGYRNFLNKIWNAARFVDMNLEGFDRSPANVSKQLLALEALEDQWIMSRLQRMIEETDKHLEAFRFHDAAQGLYDFFWKDYCDWYIEAVKRRLISPSPLAGGAGAPSIQGSGGPLSPRAQPWEGGGEGSQAQAVLWHVLTIFSKLIHPFMPFLSEELREQMNTGKDLTASSPWPVVDQRFINQEAEKRMAGIMEAVQTIRSLRTDLDIQPGTDIQVQIGPPDRERHVFFNAQKTLMELLTRNVAIRVLTPGQEKPQQSVTQVLEAGEIHVMVSDVAKARERLHKQLREVEARLASTKIHNGAPEEVKTEIAAKKEELVRQSKTLQQYLTSLN